MVTEAQLVAAVVAAPGDDAPRLVYADWLSERGDPRGELVALQCELARMVPGQRRDDLRSRCGILERRMTAPLGVDGARWRWHRGFASELIADRVAPVVEAGDQLFAAAPLLDTLVINEWCDQPAPIRQLLRAPWFAKVKRLGWMNVGAGDSLAGFADEAMRGVAALHVTPYWGLGVVGLLERLGATRELAELTALDFNGAAVDDDALAALFRGHGFPALVRIDLSRCRVYRDGCQVLADRAPRLRAVNLYANRNLGDGMRALVRLRALEELDVTAQLSNAACRALVALPALRRLSLRTCQLGDRCVADLLGVARRLEALDLRGTAVSALGRRMLVDAFGERVALDAAAT
jgi:uncharacterized protein (TIGR02996 family)